MRNKVNNLKRQAKERFYSNIETNLTESSNNNKREFWKVIRHFVKSNSSSSTIPPLITEENGHRQIHVTDGEKAECLNKYFTSISTVPNTTPDLPAFQLKQIKHLPLLKLQRKKFMILSRVSMSIKLRDQSLFIFQQHLIPKY